MTHFENKLEVYEAINNIEGIATGRSNIAIATLRIEGGNITEEMVLKDSRDLYELLISEYGEEIENTIDMGRILAGELQDANLGV